SEKAQLEAALSNLRKDAEDAKSAKTYWESAYSTLYQQHESQTVELKEKLAQQSQNLQLAEQNVASLTSIRDSLMASRGDLSERIERLETAKLSFDSERASLDGDIARFSQHNSDLRTELVQTQQLGESLKRSNAKLQDQVDSLGNRNTELAQYADDVHAKNQTLAEDNTHYQRELVKLQDQKRVLDREIEVVKQEAAKAADDCAYWQQVYSNLYYQNEASVNKLKEVSEEKQSLEELAADQQKQIEDTDHYIQNFDNIRAKDRKDFQHEVGEWIKRYQRLQNEYSELADEQMTLAQAKRDVKEAREERNLFLEEIDLLCERVDRLEEKRDQVNRLEDKKTDLLAEIELAGEQLDAIEVQFSATRKQELESFEKANLHETRLANLKAEEEELQLKLQLQKNLADDTRWGIQTESDLFRFIEMADELEFLAHQLGAEANNGVTQTLQRIRAKLLELLEAYSIYPYSVPPGETVADLDRDRVAIPELSASEGIAQSGIRRVINTVKSGFSLRDEANELILRKAEIESAINGSFAKN
ncbi:MAG: hypothetical protein AAF226_05905, partial [Verrucomicrobiota bacterium]